MVGTNGLLCIQRKQYLMEWGLFFAPVDTHIHTHRTIATATVSTFTNYRKKLSTGRYVAVKSEENACIGYKYTWVCVGVCVCVSAF